MQKYKGLKAYCIFFCLICRKEKGNDNFRCYYK